MTTFDTYTKLASHFDGADEATAYTDPIAGAYTFVNSAQLDTADKKFGSASLLLERDSNDYVTLPDSADWNFGAGNFTIDWLMKLNSYSLAGGFMGQYEDANNEWVIYENGTGKITVYFKSGGTVKAEYITTSVVNDTGVWHHWAVVRNGTTCLLFKDGVSQALTEITAFGTNDVGDIAGLLTVGAQLNGVSWSGSTDGWLDEVRISKGIARWTSNFTPFTRAYPIRGKVVFTSDS